MARKRVARWYAFFQKDIAFPAWIVLGLVAVSVGIPLLELFASWFGSLRVFPFPGLSAITLYILLTLVQPRLSPWSRYRLLYLCAVFVLSFAITIWGPSQLRFASYIAVYGVVAHARVTFSRAETWLVEGTIILATLLGMMFMGGTELEEPLRRELVVLGIGTSQSTLLLQFGIWLLGLLFVHAFTGLGVRERAARLRSDDLVKELTEAQAQLRAYALRAEGLATTRERARVAREVHDTLAQGLAAIKMHLETGSAVFRQNPELAYIHIERARELAGEHLSEARGSILELRTDVLEGQTLPTALAALTSTWRPWDGTGADGGATFFISGIAENTSFWCTVSPAIQLACYRISQEAVSNATKHGHAHHIDVELSIEADELCFTITDDGIGFDPSAIPMHTEQGSFGIIGMHERMRLLGGRLEIISAPGTGTQVAAMIPLSVATNAEDGIGKKERV